MATFLRCLFVSLVLIFSASRLVAASAEDRAFEAAEKSFAGGVWDRAEAEFAQFVTDYRQSPRVPKALLLQAEAQFNRGKFEQAIALLAAHQGQAGNLADEYLYWQGEAHLHNNNPAAAADVFGKLTGSFPASARRLEASVGEAAARAKQSDWPRVTALLQNPSGAFRLAAQAKPDNESFTRGLLLLAEAELAQKHYPEAEVALQPIASSKLKPDLDWQRKYLICRAQLGAGRTEEAKTNSVDLLLLAETTGRQDLLAESVAFRAGVFEQLGQRVESTAMYQRNLTTNAPAAQQQQAILKLGQLALAQNQLAAAIQSLETFLGRISNSPATDVALLTLGELHLKRHVSPGETNRADLGSATNHWQQALTNFDRVISASSNSVLVGKAQLGRGWCFSLSNMIPESVAAFKAAAVQLPPSEDLAVARFKLAGGLFAQKDCAGALQNYRGALEVAVELPQVKETLAPQALYQMLRASLCLKDLASAEDAMRKIVQSHRQSAVADRSVLLVGQGYADAQKPDQARARFKEFIELFPESALRAEVELAMAQTHELEFDWLAAMSAYEAWLKQFVTNQLRPQAEFRRALATARAGAETNALTLFTNFVAQYATNDLAPLAQRWVADYYWNQREYLAAEINYKLIFQNWQSSELANQARMDAGLAAAGRPEYADAINHFTNLTSKPNCPLELRVQALFAYGDALRLWPPAEATNKFANLKEAIQVFGTIVESGTNTESAALAWGEIGKCYFQLGAQDARNYESASNAYQQVISSPYAGFATRSQAKVGLALVAEKQAETKSGTERTALLKSARDHYLDVFFYEKILRDGEKPDWFWVKEAGLGAARVIESTAASAEEWAQAAKLYEGLKKLLPPLQVNLEKKIAKAQEHLPPEKK